MDDRRPIKPFYDRRELPRGKYVLARAEQIVGPEPEEASVMVGVAETRRSLDGSPDEYLDRRVAETALEYDAMGDDGLPVPPIHRPRIGTRYIVSGMRHDIWFIATLVDYYDEEEDLGLRYRFSIGIEIGGDPTFLPIGYELNEDYFDEWEMQPIIPENRSTWSTWHDAPDGHLVRRQGG
jgi:hypothetical protein